MDNQTEVQKNIDSYLKKYFTEKFKQEIIIWGNGIGGKLLLEYLNHINMGNKMIAFCNSNHKSNSSQKILICGKPLLSPEQVYNKKNVHVIIASDYHKEIIEIIKKDYVGLNYSILENEVLFAIRLIITPNGENSSKIKEADSIYRPQISEPRYKSHFKTPVVILGTGHSGSGAVKDLLTELDNTTVLGYRDESDTGFEVDFVSRIGGIFSLEKALSSQNIYIQAFYLRLFVLTVRLNFFGDNSSFHKSVFFSFYDDNYLKYSLEFLNEISYTPLDAKELPTDFIDDSPLSIYFAKLEKNIRYFKHDIDKRNFRIIANKYIYKVLHNVSSKEFLILDQFFTDCTGDFQRYKQFLDNCKIIVVLRDPRDTFSTGAKLNLSWIPRNEQTFIDWYKRRGAKQLLSNAKDENNVLVVHFEDLVLDYDNTRNKILDFLNIDKAHHVNKFQYFDPSISRKNVMLYSNYKAEYNFDIIYSQLEKFCYLNKINVNGLK